MTRSLLFQSNLPTVFWSYALIHSTILINCMPSPFLNNRTPYEKLHGRIYDIESLRVFGCLCFSSTLAANRKKLDPRTATFVFLGFKPNTKGFIMFALKTKAISVSRNVIFYEDCFPSIGQDKPDVVTILPIPSSHAINQPNGVSLELPVDHIMPVPNNADFDPLTLEQSFNTTRISLRQTHKPSKYKDFHVSYLF